MDRVPEAACCPHREAGGIPLGFYPGRRVPRGIGPFVLGYYAFNDRRVFLKGLAQLSKRYNTNLAAEFHVLSVLYRLGADAALSLGNKKAVDITVVRETGIAMTVDVKGVAGRDDWPADNIKVPDHDRHFLALVSFEGRIADPDQVPSIWIVPAGELATFLRTYKSRKVVSRAAVRSKGAYFKGAWNLLLGHPMATKHDDGT